MVRVTARVMATASTWALVMAMRLLGNEEGTCEGGKGNGNGNEGGGQHKEGKGGKAMVMVTRIAGKWTTMATKRAMVMVTRVAGEQQRGQ